MTTDSQPILVPDSSELKTEPSVIRMVAHWVLTSIGIGLLLVVAFVVTINIVF